MSRDSNELNSLEDWYARFFGGGWMEKTHVLKEMRTLDYHNDADKFMKELSEKRQEWLKSHDASEDDVVFNEDEVECLVVRKNDTIGSYIEQVTPIPDDLQLPLRKLYEQKV